MIEILWLKFCDWNFVTEILWQKFCDWNFVTENLWRKFLTEILWLNFVIEILWLKFCDWNLVTKLLWLNFCDWKGLDVVFIPTDSISLKQTNISGFCARSYLIFQKITENSLNTKSWVPWRPSKGPYRRAASLLGWKSSLSQLFLGRHFTRIFFKKIYMNKHHVDWWKEIEEKY